MKRVLSAYDKTTGYHVYDVEIQITVDELRQLFTPYTGDNRMIMRYDVDREKIVALKPFIAPNVDFDFDEYEYDVGAYST